MTMAVAQGGVPHAGVVFPSLVSKLKPPTCDRRRLVPGATLTPKVQIVWPAVQPAPPISQYVVAPTVTWTVLITTASLADGRAKTETAMASATTVTNPRILFI